MKTHIELQELLPLYVAHQLDTIERTAVRAHLTHCAECQSELALWEQVSAEIFITNEAVSIPVRIKIKALQHIRGKQKIGHRSHGYPQIFSGLLNKTRGISAQPSILLRTSQRPKLSERHLNTPFLQAINLLRAQTYLIKREMWPTSAAVMALGVIIALLAERVEALNFLAPLVAAASLAMLFNPENDPAYELTRATPTSPWKILLARLSVVSAYNLGLALAASVLMLLIWPPNLLGMIIMGWLAPLAFLSALALLLSVWIGTNNAITISYGLWLFQYIQVSKIGAIWRFTTSWNTFLTAYRAFWTSPGLLLLLSLGLVGLALISVQHAKHISTTPAT
jgi:hypothetical protein